MIVPNRETTCNKQNMYSVSIVSFSMNLLAFYHKWRPFIGYTFLSSKQLDYELEISIVW